MIGAIAGRELRSLFLSPLAWVMLAVIQSILAWIFLVAIDNFVLIQPRLINMDSAPGVTDIVITPLFSLLGILLLLITPLLTMRLISEERRNKSLALLLSAPVSANDIVLGKFFAILVFVGIMLLLCLFMAVSLIGSANIDYGQIVGCVIGLLLLAATFTAIGLYMSCLTQHPTVAATLSFGVLFMLWIVGRAGQADADGPTLLSWFAIFQHQEGFYRGLINSSDIAYYLIFTIVFLLLSIRRLDAERIQA